MSELQVAAESLGLVLQIAEAILTAGTTHEEVALAQLTRAHLEAKLELEGEETGARLKELLDSAELTEQAWQRRAEHLRSKYNRLLAGEEEA
ncbi:MAG: hypothetical protein CMM54_00095 [Rhodospirillaceae bacterium]|nr:hypothetical protein [Rhodospirillaceae bacterium]